MPALPEVLCRLPAILAESMSTAATSSLGGALYLGVFWSAIGALLLLSYLYSLKLFITALEGGGRSLLQLGLHECH